MNIKYPYSNLKAKKMDRFKYFIANQWNIGGELTKNHSRSLNESMLVANVVISSSQKGHSMYATVHTAVFNFHKNVLFGRAL